MENFRAKPSRKIFLTHFYGFMYKIGSEPYPLCIRVLGSIYMFYSRVACEEGEIPKIVIVFDESFQIMKVFSAAP